MPDYFVVRTTQHCEQQAKLGLEARGFEVFLPLALFSRLRNTRWLNPLFPGFVFVKDAGRGVQSFVGVCGVKEVVRVGNEPLRLGADVIARIERYRGAEGELVLPRLPASLTGLLAASDGFDLLMRPMRGALRSLAFVAWLVKRRPARHQLERAA